MSRPRGRPKSETASASGTREGSRKLLKVLVAEQEDAAHCDDDNGDDADAVQLLFQETEETGDYKIKVAVDPRSVSRVNSALLPLLVIVTVATCAVQIWYNNVDATDLLMSQVDVGVHMGIDAAMSHALSAVNLLSLRKGWSVCNGFVDEYTGCLVLGDTVKQYNVFGGASSLRSVNCTWFFLRHAGHRHIGQLVCAKCYGAWRNLDRRKKGDTVDYTDPSSTVRYSAIPRHDLEERSLNLAAVVNNELT